MNTSVKVFCTAAVIIGAALAYAWPWIKMEFAGSAHYTEQDKREYEFYTPDLLKNMPRITARYDFAYANITGPASHVFTIRFYDTDDISRVSAYLTSAGYKLRENCFIEAECWSINDNAYPPEVVTVAKLKSNKNVEVSVVHNFY
ncbi:hypothetical protein [Dryocola sp. BD586]|uniref:hypothetical protein n=1 Tax=Dryocola sp. BD586 TaxID=3133271 RepID=UPI003F5099AC